MGWRDTITDAKDPAKGSWKDTIQDIPSKEPSVLDKDLSMGYVPGGMTGRGLIRGGLETLPLAGGAAGALGGEMAMPAGGGIPGAGLGMAAGKGLERLGKYYLLGEKPKEGDIEALTNAAKEGALYETGGKIIGEGGKYLAGTKYGQKALGLLGKAGTKVGELFTGVPEQEISTYAKNADEIKSMAKASDNSTAEAADQMRSKFAGSIDKTRSQMNEQISSTLKNSDKTVDPNPILQSLSEAKGNLNPKLEGDQIEQIDGLAKTVRSLMNEDGQISIQDAHDLKRYLQDKASQAYRDPGRSQLGTRSAQAARSGAAQARLLVNEAEPAVASANNKLSQLHDIEDSMNMNLITEGKPEAGLLAAGSGGNARNAKSLQELGEATGTDMLGGAQKLSAMRTFGSPKLMASDTTGKAVGRMGLGAGLGYLVGHTPGAVIGTAATSPMALRGLIDAGILTKSTTQKLLENPAGRQVLGKLSGLLKDENR